mmetsp:Transcript_56375/g.174823  ORF Transcript_56375/g.174823 Transcript_56375/m.174823 type:complete len:223 (-) Transcript_56375:254-922(-)
MQASREIRRRLRSSRPLLCLVAVVLVLQLALRALGSAFTPPARLPAEARRGVALRVSLTTDETEVEEVAAAPARGRKKRKGGKLPSQLEGLSAEEIAARKAKALDVWESLKVDVAAELERYQTFRMDKFEKFMRADSRGLALFELYKPGTPEYAEFFEEHMGPYIFELAEGKLKEGLSQALGVIAVVGTIAAIVGYFGTDIIQGITAPFTGFAEQFVELYGF